MDNSENSENKIVDLNSFENQPVSPASQTPQEPQPAADAPQAAPEPASAPEPAPASAPAAPASVVTSDVIAERLRAASSKNGAPLSTRRDAARRRDGNDAKGDGKGDGKGDAKGDGKRDRRERRERRERPEAPKAAPRGPVSHIPVPNRRERLSGDLEDEFNELFGGDPNSDALGAIMNSGDDGASSILLEEGSKVTARIDSIHGDSVFVDVGAREQGVIPLKQFPDDMELKPGMTFEAVVTKFNGDDGVYEVSLPLAAAEVGDWLSLTKGAIVEAVVTKTNQGGLECAVGRLRAFMPYSQVAPYRVENPEAFVGERWKAVVTEINPERRNLVVSRRVLMEKEREEQREKTLSELAEGQSREGLVRKVIDAGAFVDLGGVDGFIPVSMMSWARVKHPSDVVKEGDRIVVTVVKIDLDRNRISLSLKDAAHDPWNTVDENVRVGDVVRGCVTKIMAFGAFVEVGAGLEGLVHISEIAYQRVNDVADVLKVGDYVDVKVLAVDLEKRKISLSIKKTMEDPREKARREAQEKENAEAATAAEQARVREEAEIKASEERIRKLQSKGPLKGGLNRGDDGGTGLHF